jgi:hypothetical protein
LGAGGILVGEGGAAAVPLRQFFAGLEQRVRKLESENRELAVRAEAADIAVAENKDLRREVRELRAEVYNMKRLDEKRRRHPPSRRLELIRDASGKVVGADVFDR